MKRKLALLMAAAACTPSQPQPPTPEHLAAPKLGITTRRGASVLWVIPNWTAPGQPDSIIVVATAGGQPTQTHRLLGTITRDSFAFTPPAPSLTNTGTITVRSKRRGLITSSQPGSWTYTEPDVPPPAPIIDSIPLRPLSVKLEATQPGVAATAKNRQQFCAFVGFRSGRVGDRRAQTWHRYL